MLALTGAGIFTLGGVERAMAVGAFAAGSLGALVALTQLRARFGAMRAWMDIRESDLSTFADDRAAAVARQFAWAVDELVGVRAELRRVEALRERAEEVAAVATSEARSVSAELHTARMKLSELDGVSVHALRAKLTEVERVAAVRERDRRAAEERARLAEQRAAELDRTLELIAATIGGENLPTHTNGPLTFDWTLEFDGSFHALRLRCMNLDVRPRRGRIVDTSGHPVAETANARGRQSRQLVLRIPQSVAAAVEQADWSAFRLEVLIGDAWRSAVLVRRGDPQLDQHTRAHDGQAARAPAIRVVV